MWISDKWRDFELIDCSRGEKLERWGDQILVRPDPQAIWDTPRRNPLWDTPSARYARSSSGGGNQTVFDLKQIIRTALDKGASALILVHNHPGGNPRPSRADIRHTDAIRRGAAAVALTLLDHVVIADDSFFSFTDDRLYNA